MAVASSLAIIGIFIASTASAASSTNRTDTVVQTPDAVRDATVNLLCKYTKGRRSYITTGSGVFVSERGIILTNAHVAQYFLLEEAKGKLKGSCTVRTGAVANEAYSADVLYLPSEWIKANSDELLKKEPRGTGENDFAFLYVTGSVDGSRLPDKFPSLSPELRSVSAGEPVLVSGYPAEKLSYKQVRDKLKMVTASSTVLSTKSYDRSTSTDMMSLTPSAAGEQGVSGGPVLGAGNGVLGIVSNRSSESVRAITLSYIDRALRSRMATPLSQLFRNDLSLQARISGIFITADMLQTLSDSLTTKK